MVLDRVRLTTSLLKLDIDGLRRGIYSDKYFENIVQVLQWAKEAGYTFKGNSPRDLPVDPSGFPVGDVEVEAQVFTRRSPFVLVAGMDVALALLRKVTGYYNATQFVETWNTLKIEAVNDGTLIHYDGHPENVRPSLKIYGRYRDFAMLETPLLGILTRASRIATNVYQVLQAAQGKPILYFPARFDLPEVQPIDGYAYWLAVQRYNAETGSQIRPFVSTDAQARWWGGRGGGTVPHSLIACFLADTTEAMVAFAEYVPNDVPRVVLADFNNDVIRDSLATLKTFWDHYLTALIANDTHAQQRWTLYGVRLDTSANMRDVAVEPDGEKGVSPQLVRLTRQALDQAWEGWGVSQQWVDAARDYCRRVKIVVSGGFSAARIAEFEAQKVPADIYGVGSSLLRNADEVSTDYTMDIVRVKVHDQWIDIAKTGRRPNTNPDLKPVDLSFWS